MNPTVTYLRVSTAKQEVLQQDMACARYCEMQAVMDADTEQDWTPYTTVTDADVSGTRPFHDRPGGLAILQAARRGQVKRIVVAKVDRFGRNAESILQTIRNLSDLRVDCHFLDLNMSTDTPMGKCMLTVMAAFAELERNRITERIHDRLDAKRSIRTIPGSWGELCGRDAPYGWQPIDTERHNKSGKPTKELILDPNEIRYLHHIIQLRYGPTPTITGDTIRPTPGHDPVSYAKIAKIMNQAGAETKTGRRFSGGIVESYLSNKMTRLYIAQEMRPHTDDHQDPLSDELTWAPGEEERLNQLIAI